MNIAKSQKLQRQKTNLLHHLKNIDLSPYPILKKHAFDTAACSTLIETFYSPSQKRTINNQWTCKHSLLCPLCSNRRMLTFAHRIKILSQANDNHIFLTTTLKNHPNDNLKEQLEKLKSSLHKLRDRTRKGCFPALHIDASWCYSIEIKRSSRYPYYWHPHIHALVSSKTPFNYTTVDTDLKKIWKSITKDSFITDARPLHADQDIMLAIVEVVSYAVKFSKLDPLDIISIYDSSYRKRFFGGTGIYRKKLPLDPIPKDLIPMGNWDIRNYNNPIFTKDKPEPPPPSRADINSLVNFKIKNNINFL